MNAIFARSPVTRGENAGHVPPGKPKIQIGVGKLNRRPGKERRGEPRDMRKSPFIIVTKEVTSPEIAGVLGILEETTWNFK